MWVVALQLCTTIYSHLFWSLLLKYLGQYTHCVQLLGRKARCSSTIFDWSVCGLRLAKLPLADLLLRYTLREGNCVAQLPVICDMKFSGHWTSLSLIVNA